MQLPEDTRVDYLTHFGSYKCYTASTYSPFGGNLQLI